MMKDQVPVPSADNRKSDLLLLVCLLGLLAFVFIQPNADIPEQNENLLQHTKPIGRKMDHVTFRNLNHYRLRKDAPALPSGQLVTRDAALFNRYFTRIESRLSAESKRGIDFSREFVIAVVCDSNYIPAQPEPVSLKIISELTLQLEYRIPRIELMYDAAASPVMLIAVPMNFWRTVLIQKVD